MPESRIGRSTWARICAAVEAQSFAFGPARPPQTQDGGIGGGIHQLGRHAALNDLKAPGHVRLRRHLPHALLRGILHGAELAPNAGASMPAA
ncbi:MAG: hypothetical protein R2911_11815 [Caldilineaceae bacterium]